MYIRYLRNLFHVFLLFILADSVQFNPSNPEKDRVFNEKMEQAVKQKQTKKPLIGQSQDQASANQNDQTDPITSIAESINIGEPESIQTSKLNLADGAQIMVGHLGDLKSDLLHDSIGGISCALDGGDRNTGNDFQFLGDNNRMGATSQLAVTSAQLIVPTPHLANTSSSHGHQQQQQHMTSSTINNNTNTANITNNTNSSQGVIPLTLDSNSQNLLMANPLAALSLDPRLLQTSNMAMLGAGGGDGGDPGANSVLQGLQMAPVSLAPQNGAGSTGATDMPHFGIMGIFPNM